jgi:hypothetical protein
MARETRKGKSLMDKPEPMAMMGMQDTGRRRKHREEKKTNKVHFLFLHFDIYIYIVRIPRVEYLE